MNFFPQQPFMTRATARSRPEKSNLLRICVNGGRRHMSSPSCFTEAFAGTGLDLESSRKPVRLKFKQKG